MNKEEIRDYIKSEIIKCNGKIDIKYIIKILSVNLNGSSIKENYFDKKKPKLISCEDYLGLQNWLNDSVYPTKFKYLKLSYPDLLKNTGGKND